LAAKSLNILEIVCLGRKWPRRQFFSLLKNDFAVLIYKKLLKSRQTAKKFVLMNFFKTLRTSLIAVRDSKNIFGVLFFGYDFLLLKRKNSLIVCFEPLHFVAKFFICQIFSNTNNFLSGIKYQIIGHLVLDFFHNCFDVLPIFFPCSPNRDSKGTTRFRFSQRLTHFVKCSESLLRLNCCCRIPSKQAQVT
jgi:hypothetical protein